MIAYGFGLKDLSYSEATIFLDLKQLLIGMRSVGQRPLLIIDKAQNLGPVTLRKLQLLMELRWNRESLIQIFLFGGKILQQMILEPNMNSLYKKINAVISLEPLNEKSTRAYIKHKLHQSRWKNDPQLADEIYPVLFNYSHGVPRLINLICSQILLYGMIEEQHFVGLTEINAVLEQMHRDQMLPPPLLLLSE